MLISAKEAGAPSSDQEIVANMTTVLLAGNASIGHYFTNLIYALWLNPDQRELVRSNPTRIEDAIEEGVRWDTSTQCFARQTMTRGRDRGRHDPGRFTADRALRVGQSRRTCDPRAGSFRRRACQGAAFRLRRRPSHLPRRANRPPYAPRHSGGDAARRRRLRLDMANAQRVPHLMVRGFSRLPMRW